MFLNNKYTSWYISLIANAQSRQLPPATYTEKHHIIPKCMGGPDTSNNLVRLTAKEHFIAHRLLVKMTEGEMHRKMVFALWRMTHEPKNKGKRHVVSPSQYEQLKTLMAINIKEQNTGRKPTEQERINQKTGLAKKGAPWNKGKKMPPQFGAAVSQRRMGKKSSDDTCNKISAVIIKWHQNRNRTSKSTKGRLSPRYTSIIENMNTQEQFVVLHLREWLAERGLKPNAIQRGFCEYKVVRRFVTRTGEEVPLRRK
jgi:hypothetical protein